MCVLILMMKVKVWDSHTIDIPEYQTDMLRYAEISQVSHSLHAFEMREITK